MSLTNFSLPFGPLAQPTHTTWGATISPLHPVHQLAASTNNLLYSPVDHQQQPDDGQAPAAGTDFYKNNPYGPPQVQQQQQQQQQYQYNNNNNNNRYKSGNTYLPPPIQTASVRSSNAYQQQFSHINAQQQFSNSNNNNVVYKTQTAAAAAATLTTTSTRTYGESSYNRFPATQPQQQQLQQQQQQQQLQQQQLQQQQQQDNQSQQQQQYLNNFNTNPRTTFDAQQTVSQQQQPQQQLPQQQQQPQQQKQPQLQQPNYNKVEPRPTVYGKIAVTDAGAPLDKDGFPERPPGFTRVQAGQGSRTQVHAVLDYDADEGEEDYYDENDEGEAVTDADGKKSSMPTVTPIQGPIFLKNGTVPVVPLFSYPTINNGTFVQIPIWWTALSVALGLDVRGDIIKGVPCIKRYHQLFCPTAGNSYPIDKIERFIDDNKALMRRMYGDFEMNMDAGGPRQQTKQRRRRFIDEPDIFIPPGVFPAVIPPDDEEGPHASNFEEGESYFGKLRNKRQANQKRGGAKNKGSSFNPTSGPNNPGNAGSSTGRLDACESKIEIVTPYWASNSAGKIRAIVNTQHFEQAIHQEICSKTHTPRCQNDCGCEQKYKWHRLLSYDPDNDCKGIFMDWFLFPSCCVCRCNP